MTATVDPPVRDVPADRPKTKPARPARPLLVAGAASLTAGIVHAAAIGAHHDHPQAAQWFAIVAMFQLAWGVAAIVWPSRRLAIFGIGLNVALVIGWAVAKTKGIPFISGLDVPEGVQFADALCAALAFYAAMETTTYALHPRRVPARPKLANFSAGLLIALAFPGMVEAGNHVHAHTSVVIVNGKATQTTAAAPVVKFDPTKPLDFGGVAGVTPEEQARAENLVADTLIRLPQWSDSAVAEAHGFHTIGDGATGDEHLINWSYINDDKILDPDFPEALVYNTRSGKRVLEAAMFMLKPGSTLDTVPDIGGALTQWHIHDNLCFTNDPVAPRVAGLTTSGGKCTPPLVNLEPVPMIHVWIINNPCGPFAALEGVGAGQVKPGETRNCDAAHGSGL